MIEVVLHVECGAGVVGVEDGDIKGHGGCRLKRSVGDEQDTSYPGSTEFKNKLSLEGGFSPVWKMQF